MSVIADVEAKEGTEEAAPRGKYALVKGSPEALGVERVGDVERHSHLSALVLPHSG